MDNKSFVWRIWVAITLTSLGVFYYLVFLFYLCGGIPIDKIHGFMTNTWPDFAADSVPLIAPTFLFVGLGLWYSYNQKNKPKPVPEPQYSFEFKTVDKSREVKPEPEFIFESGQNTPLVQTTPELPQPTEDTK